MTRTTLSPAVFENLLKHLIDFEEGKDKLIQQFFPYFSKERTKWEKVFNDYVKQVENLIKTAHRSDTASNNLPFAIIGSEVKVQNMENQEIYKFRLVSPFEGSTGTNDASYLSPVGESLLLKKVGDHITVDAPGGVFHYKIISISIA